MESQRKSFMQVIALEMLAVGAIYIYLEHVSGESTIIPNLWLRASKIFGGIAESWGRLAIEAENEYYTSLEKLRLS